MDDLSRMLETAQFGERDSQIDDLSNLFSKTELKDYPILDIDLTKAVASKIDSQVLTKNDLDIIANEIYIDLCISRYRYLSELYLELNNSTVLEGVLMADKLMHFNITNEQQIFDLLGLIYNKLINPESVSETIIWIDLFSRTVSHFNVPKTEVFEILIELDGIIPELLEQFPNKTFLVNKKLQEFARDLQ
jgi:hypothetical protein